VSAVYVEAGPDAGAVWHWGDPLREQRLLESGQAAADLSHFPRFAVSGPDRLTWLHAITAQDFASLPPGRPVVAHILDPQGRIAHTFSGVDDGRAFHGRTEPGCADALLAWLRKMVFAAKVEVLGVDTAGPPGLSGEDGGGRPLASAEGVAAAAKAGMWAREALRIAAGRPRVFLDTDELTIPNEIAMPDGDRLGEGVHLKKGCYPGQETVARVHNLGHPPRRLVKLLLDGSADRLPEVGSPVLADGEVVGRMGTAAIHYELGPVGLALVKRTVPVEAPLSVEGIAAAQEVVVDPDVGLHFRPAQQLRSLSLKSAR
jgi:folate-binding protein YgfZ